MRLPGSARHWQSFHEPRQTISPVRLLSPSTSWAVHVTAERGTVHLRFPIRGRNGLSAECSL